MSACNFEYLLEFVNNQLDPDKQLEVYGHLCGCDICRDAVCQISRDLNRERYSSIALIVRNITFPGSRQKLRGLGARM